MNAFVKLSFVLLLCVMSFSLVAAKANSKSEYMSGSNARINVVSKPGNCPSVDPNLMGICVEMCQSDASCPGAAKCCSNGCGHVCKTPIQ